MLSKLRHGRTALLGIAFGLLIAVFWFRGTPGLSDDLEQLRDGAMLLVILSLILSWVERRVLRRQTSPR